MKAPWKGGSVQRHWGKKELDIWKIQEGKKVKGSEWNEKGSEKEVGSRMQGPVDQSG